MIVVLKTSAKSRAQISNQVLSASDFSFWWGLNRRQGKGINWLNWDKLTTRNEYEGMCFRGSSRLQPKLYLVWYLCFTCTS